MNQKTVTTSLVILMALGFIAFSLENKGDYAHSVKSNATTTLANPPTGMPSKPERKKYEDDEYGFTFTYADHLSPSKATWEGVPMDLIYLYGDDGYGSHSFSVIPGNRNDSTLNKSARSLDDYMKPYVSEERHGSIVIRRKISILEQEKVSMNGREALKQRYSAHMLDKNDAVSDPTIEGTIIGNVRYVFFDGKDRFVIFDAYDPAFDITEDPEIAKTSMKSREPGPLEEKRSDLSLKELDAMANSFRFK